MRFRGAVVSSFVSRGWPANVLEIEPDHLTFRSVLGEPVTVNSRDVRAVEFRQMRLPLMWATFIVVRIDGGYVPTMFVPLRATKVRRGLIALGWEVEDGPRVSGSSVLFSPHPKPGQ